MYASTDRRGTKTRKIIQTAFHQPLSSWSRKRSPITMNNAQRKAKNA
jgi:hypothetical protein